MKQTKSGSKLLVLLVTVAALVAGSILLAQSGTSQSRGDYNGDGSVGMADVLSLVLKLRAGGVDETLDYNLDGVAGSQDALDLLLDIFWRGQSVLDIVVTPLETDSLLMNPGVGFEAPNTTNEDMNRWNPKYPECSSAYYRWYWNEVEPADGEIDFAMIDKILEQVRKEKSVLSWRIMCMNGGIDVPQWLIDKGVNGWYYDENDHSLGFMPDYTDPIFIEHHERLIKAMASRYDGHPDIHHVDIGSVGSWGEWNVAGTPGGSRFVMPPESTLRDIMDLYLDNFKKTKLVMLIGGEEQLTYGIENGTGYRADCLGDWGMWGSGWYHMRDSYPPAIAASRADTAWKHAPVCFEACATGSGWYVDGMGVLMDKVAARDTTIKMSLDWHISVMHMVYGPTYDKVAQDWLDAYDEWAKKMGYRFVLSRLAHLGSVHAGGRFKLEMDWINRGVAPAYYNYPLTVRLRSLTSDVAFELPTGADVREWLPGEIEFDPVLKIPADAPPGDYAVELAMLDPYYGTPRIAWAVDGGHEDLWYSWSTVTIK